MSTYNVVIVGMGKRGKHHAAAFNANDRFKVTGICDIDEERLADAKAQVGGDVETSTDAAALTARLKPDVFCFCTMPHLRTPFVEMAVDNGAKLIAFEKPVALSTSVGMDLKRIIDGSRVKAVVSHQHRYGVHYRKIKEIIAGGALGRVHTVYGTATGWMTHMLSHMVDYARWYNDNAGATWAMAQAAGHGKFTDNHPSPDYIAGVVQFENDVRGYFECGAGAPDQPEVGKWWAKNRIGAQGTDGYAEVLTNGGWRAVTKDGASSGEGAMNYDLDMPPYIQEMADWLDDDTKPHQNNFENAYQGFEIVSAMMRSAALGGQVALPLSEPMDELELLKEHVPDRTVLVSSDVNREEFGL